MTSLLEEGKQLLKQYTREKISQHKDTQTLRQGGGVGSAEETAWWGQWRVMLAQRQGGTSPKDIPGWRLHGVGLSEAPFMALALVPSAQQSKCSLNTWTNKRMNRGMAAEAEEP